MKILIVYYSRTGRTKKIAEKIQYRLNADIDEISDTKNRAGILGWLSAGRDAGSRRLT
jgi:flavodoxin